MSERRVFMQLKLLTLQDGSRSVLQGEVHDTEPLAKRGVQEHAQYVGSLMGAELYVLDKNSGTLRPTGVTGAELLQAVGVKEVRGTIAIVPVRGHVEIPNTSPIIIPRH